MTSRDLFGHHTVRRRLELLRVLFLFEHRCRLAGNLECWARQGVLLLNASLTVRKGEPNSHANYGWQSLTNVIIQAHVPR